MVKAAPVTFNCSQCTCGKTAVSLQAATWGKKKTANIEMNKGKDKHCAEHKLNFILKKKKDILEIEKVEKKCKR